MLQGSGMLKITMSSESEALDMSAITIDFYDPTRDSLDEITNILHRAYARLAEMGFNYVAATQSTVVTQERLIAGIPYVARRNNCIIGAITYYPTVPNDIEEPNYYKNKDIAHFGQFAVAPEMQKRSIGNKLVEFIEAYALRDGKQELACDTADGAIHLIDYYKRRGYRSIGYHQWQHACYRSIILSKTLVHI
jgi:GNAT superfamily N-acetyltransferase